MALLKKKERMLRAIPFSCIGFACAFVYLSWDVGRDWFTETIQWAQDAEIAKE